MYSLKYGHVLFCFGLNLVLPTYPCDFFTLIPYDCITVIGGNVMIVKHQLSNPAGKGHIDH